jgi:DNA-binding phage protein
MKAVTIQLRDQVYDQIDRQATARGGTVAEEVVALLENRLEQADDSALIAARARMAELFRTVTGFRQTPRISREELYARGSLR